MNRRNGFAPIILIIIVAVLAVVGGGAYYVANKKAQPFVTSKGTLPPESATRTSTQVSDGRVPDNLESDGSTAQWKTYRNEQYRLEFKYPPEWKECPAPISHPSWGGDPRYIKQAMIVGFSRATASCTQPEFLLSAEESIADAYSTYEVLKKELFSKKYGGNFDIPGYGLFAVGGFPEEVGMGTKKGIRIREVSQGGYTIPDTRGVYVYTGATLLRIGYLQEQIGDRIDRVLETFAFNE